MLRRGLRSVALLPLLSWAGLVGACALAQAQSNDTPTAYTNLLSAPDDLQANVAFLQTQLEAGDFEGASVTLQRILLQSPSFDQARLIRVAVFLRLGDDAAARSDLDYLANRPLTEQQRAEAERLERHVRPSATAARFSGVIRTGLIHDSNPGQRPGSFTIGGTQVVLDEDESTGAFGQIQVNAEQPLGGEGHSLRAEASAFVRGYFEGSDAYSYARLAAGPRFDLGYAFVDLMAVAGADFIDDELYGSDLGVRAQVIADLANNVSGHVRVQAIYDAVDVNINAATDQGDGDGWQISAAPSITYRISTLWAVTANAFYATKNAGSSWFSYDAFGGGVTARYRDASGLQVRAGVGLQEVDYDAANPNVLPTVVRSDTRYTFDVAAAAPFNTVFDWFGQEEAQVWARGWALETFARYEINESNVPIYDSDNLTIGLSFAKRFSM